MTQLFSKPLIENPGKPVYVAGLLSGTSQDGLDIGIFEIEGSVEKPDIRMIRGRTVPFPDAIADKASILSFREEVRLPDVLRLSRELAEFSAEAFLNELGQCGMSSGEIHCLGSHGLTLYHRGSEGENKPSLTMQITDPDVLARETGIAVVSGFRERHIAEGGEGAPLAPILDYLCYRNSGESRVLLNIGGMANISVIVPGQKLFEVASGDTGPGNRILDEWMKKHTGRPYDQNGAAASRGKIHEKWLKAMQGFEWFNSSFPSSTGPEVFNLNRAAEFLNRYGWDVSAEDGAATLTELTAWSIAGGIKKSVRDNSGFSVYASGGGYHNAYLRYRIEYHLDRRIKSVEEIGGSVDFKEAQLFALLAWLFCFTDGISLFDARKPVRLGKLSLP